MWKTAAMAQSIAVIASTAPCGDSVNSANNSRSIRRVLWRNSRCSHVIAH